MKDKNNTENKYEAIILDYEDALIKNDIDRALSFFTDDAIWFNAKGIFKGREELKKYLTWLFKTVSDIKIFNDGVGIVVQGNKGIYQHIFECTIKGYKTRVPTFCTYLFNGNKCKIHRTFRVVDLSRSANKKI
jgi:ketosteroid isomerase-like protein